MSVKQDTEVSVDPRQFWRGLKEVGTTSERRSLYTGLSRIFWGWCESEMWMSVYDGYSISFLGWAGNFGEKIGLELSIDQLIAFSRAMASYKNLKRESTKIGLNDTTVSLDGQPIFHAKNNPSHFDGIQQNMAGIAPEKQVEVDYGQLRQGVRNAGGGVVVFETDGNGIMVKAQNADKKAHRVDANSEVQIPGGSFASLNLSGLIPGLVDRTKTNRMGVAKIGFGMKKTIQYLRLDLPGDNPRHIFAQSGIIGKVKHD
jgi:hypothetical protein